MAWSENSKPTPARDAAEMVDDAVTAVRNRGYTREHALRIVAQELGIRLRRARAIFYGDPVAMLDEELRAIRVGYLRHLDAEIASLEKRAAVTRDHLTRLRGGA